MATYVIRAGASGPVKIGRAQHVPSRVAAIQTCHYEELRVLRIMHGDAEPQMHAHFRHLRIRGEWFRFDAEMLTWEPPHDAVYEEYKKALGMEPDHYTTIFLEAQP